MSDVGILPDSPPTSHMLFTEDRAILIAPLQLCYEMEVGL